MRIAFKFFIILFIFSCNNQKQPKNEKLALTETEKPEVQKQPSLFDVLVHRQETPMQFSDHVLPTLDFSRRFTSKEILALQLDTSSIDKNEYYFLTDKKFVTRAIDSTKYLIYYKLQYGDQLAKILRVQHKDTLFDVILAMHGGDGNDQYKTTSTFINDSIFISTHTKTSGDLIQSKNNGKESTYEYYTDSIISRYQYNQSFQLKLLQKDTFQFSKQTFYRDQKKLWSHVTICGKPFTFQDKTYIWQFFIPNYNAQKGVLYTQNLLDYTTKKVILKGAEVENYVDRVTELFTTAQLGFEVKDLNFDGFEDLYSINKVKSGTAGNFTDVYLFNKELGTFEYNSIFSGYNLQTYPLKKMISHTVQNANHYSLKEVYINADATVNYINTYRTIDISVSENYKVVYSYEKTVAQKVTKKITDTITNASMTFEKWKEKHN
ncbi:XAC2610-related protein [Kordia sp.]|uniref:XAC2610-related protein n=1 Tax=Kordia sp. TaxID=1965332 RepID=UPI003B5A3571